MMIVFSDCLLLLHLCSKKCVVGSFRKEDFCLQYLQSRYCNTFDTFSHEKQQDFQRLSLADHTVGTRAIFVPLPELCLSVQTDTLLFDIILSSARLQDGHNTDGQHTDAENA